MSWTAREIYLHDSLCHNTWEGLCREDTGGRCAVMRVIREAEADERAAVVAWLKTIPGLGTGCRGEIKRAASAIELEEHLK